MDSISALSQSSGGMVPLSLLPAAWRLSRIRGGKRGDDRQLLNHDNENFENGSKISFKRWLDLYSSLDGICKLNLLIIDRNAHAEANITSSST